MQTMDLWVPSERILIFELELPKVSLRKLQEMLPWMLEDRLLSSPESFEFILGPAIDDATGLVYVIEKSVYARWMMVAESAAVRPDCMAPDFMALPYEEGRWTVCAEAGRLLVRTGPYTGFASEIDFGWQQLELLITQCEEPVRLSSLQDAEIEVPDFFQDKLDTQRGHINWGFAELPRSINLLPARLKPKSSTAFNLWLPTMATAALAVLLTLTYMLVQSWVWQRDIVLLEEAVAAGYEALFSEKLRVPAHEMLDQAEARLNLMEHQYIGLQNSPMAELNSLDRIFSTCSDCELMAISQSGKGISLSLKQSPRISSRLQGLEGWQAQWGSEDKNGYSKVSLQRAMP